MRGEAHASLENALEVFLSRTSLDLGSRVSHHTSNYPIETGQLVICQIGGFLAKVRDAIKMATWTRRMRRFLLNNGAASPSRSCAGKYGKTSKPPRFTNLGQEPTFLAKHTTVSPTL